MFDLFIGYDDQLLAESSWDLMTFQTLIGALRLVTLPMGWMDLVPIFHDDITFILQPEIPQITVPYIDNVAVKGPKLQYLLNDSTCETITENPRIHHFIWEHFLNINYVIQWMRYCGGTFSGVKLVLCVEKFWVLGHCCTFEGRIPDELQVTTIKRWDPCDTILEVRAFLGTIGVMSIFICNFVLHVHYLVQLMRKDT
jgi:hypothetical protein